MHFRVNTTGIQSSEFAFNAYFIFMLISDDAKVKSKIRFCKMFTLCCKLVTCILCVKSKPMARFTFFCNVNEGAISYYFSTT